MKLKTTKTLKIVKEDKFIFKKYKEVLKDESYIKILLFDIVKIFPNKYFIKILSKLINLVNSKVRYNGIQYFNVIFYNVIIF